MIVVGIRFKSVGKIYYFDPANLPIEKGMAVIVETARGVEYGNVVIGKRDVDEAQVVQPLKKVMRIATPQDDERYQANKEKEKEAVGICQEKIKKHDLPMRLIDVEITFDNSKIIFYFTADNRIDFRELVKDLASVFRTRIELRQIGVRDEAKMVSGVGICGRPLCCATFLGDFHPVSIKMAKDQGLSLNPTKISGNCGRLMCCLQYEENSYEEMIRNLPNEGDIVSTPEGEGQVLSVSVLKQMVKTAVRKPPKNDVSVFYFNTEEIKIIKHKPRKEERLSKEQMKELLDK